MVDTAKLPTNNVGEAQPAQAGGNEKKENNVALVFSALVLTMLMSSLGQMIFSSALPTIVGELGGVDHMSWVISAFLVTMTIAMPISGKLGDMMGRKWLYIGGIAVFVVGSAIGGFANDMNWLILGRAVQGFGAGFMMISYQSIIAAVSYTHLTLPTICSV